MKGTLHIGTFAKIPVLVHWSFGLLLLIAGYAAFTTSGSISFMLIVGAIIFSMFFCVILHEYGHALTARRFGVRTQDIIILPIGGVARLARLPDNPMEEFYIAIAGPLVNIAILIILSPYFFVDNYAFDNLLWLFNQRGMSIGSDAALIVPMLFAINLALAVFNLIPAFPMDGGRIFRSLLSLKISRQTATFIAARLGQILAIGLIIYAAYNYQIITVFVGIFVFYQAMMEYKNVKIETILSQQTAGDIARSHFTVFKGNDLIQEAVSIAAAGKEASFLIENEDGKINRVLHREFLEEAQKQQDFYAPIQKYSSPTFEFVQSTEPLKNLIYRIQDKGYSILPVIREGRLVGVIDRPIVNNMLDELYKNN